MMHWPVILLRVTEMQLTYQSKTTQNELITIIGEQILHTIVNRSSTNGGFFSVIADEVQDCSNSEQLALVVRYCMGNEGIRAMQKYYI